MAERRLLAPVLAALLLALVACGGERAEPTTLSEQAIVLDEPYQPADVPLVDTEGEPFDLAADTDADLTLIFFGYTNCPDICQQVMSTISAARLRLDEADRERLGVVFVTTDPARDTGPVLRKYLDRFDPSFVGATGELDDIVDLSDSLAVHIAEGPRLPSGGYEVEHNDQVEALTRTDTVTTMWMRDVSAGDLANDLKVLLDQEAS